MTAGHAARIALDLKEGEAVHIGAALVRLERKSGRSARLVVQAPRDVLVRRSVRQGAGTQMFTKTLASGTQAMF